MTTELFTIGYEGASLENFLATLSLAGVERIIDVRDVPASRKPGFSKGALSAALDAVGIDYRHLKPLGDPKLGREAMRRGDREEFLRIYSEHSSRGDAQAALQFATDLATDKPSALLCYERDPKDCHRTLVGDMMKELGSFAVRHLGVVAKIPTARSVEDAASRGALRAA